MQNLKTSNYRLTLSTFFWWGKKSRAILGRYVYMYSRPVGGFCSEQQDELRKFQSSMFTTIVGLWGKSG